MADLSCDVLVIGAGIAGSSAAFHLASAGVRTVLAERRHPASGPTGASSAVCHLFYTLPELSQLARRGCQLLKDLPAMTGCQPVFHETGVLWVAGEGNAALWRETARRIRDEEGGGLEAVSPETCERLLPHFDMAGVAVGIWEERYGHADPYDATNALAAAARERGATLLQQRPVAAIETSGGRAVGARLVDGSRIAADRIVVAAGPWTRRLLEPLGAALPLFVEHHAMAVLHAPGAARRLLPFSWVDDVNAHYARPEREDTILIGTWAGGGTGLRNEAAERPREVTDPDGHEGTASEEESLFAVQQMLPRCAELAELGIRPGYACMYDMSPDDLPIIDSLPGLEGLFFAAGSSGHGFKLGPAVGEQLALLATGSRSELLRPFALGRFA